MSAEDNAAIRETLAVFNERSETNATRLLRAVVAEMDELRAVSREMLAEFYFACHPGRPCHKSGPVDDERIARWRAAIKEPT